MARNDRGVFLIPHYCNLAIARNEVLCECYGQHNDDGDHYNRCVDSMQHEEVEDTDE